ncbi:MAG: hypothetical protein EOO75_02200, partial [Myxococcales bacterium]
MLENGHWSCQPPPPPRLIGSAWPQALAVEGSLKGGVLMPNPPNMVMYEEEFNQIQHVVERLVK